eukprot:7506658-Pyramimonas_sp.AAC.1
MHCLAASGGIGQFVLNRVLRALLEASAEFTLEVLDEWAKCAKLPRSHQQLPKMFFQERYVKGVNKHIRAFASEVLSATVVLTMFMEEVVEDDDEVLSDHLLILKMQRAIFDALERGDLEDARSTIEAYYEYAKLYARLYPECRKPKLHFTLHALQSWVDVGILLSCFSTERKRRTFKKTMTFSYRAACSTALATELRRMVNSFAQGHVFTGATC